MCFATTWRSEARGGSGVFVERYQKTENGILADKAMSKHSGTRSADKVSGQGGQHLVHDLVLALPGDAAPGCLNYFPSAIYIYYTIQYNTR